MTTSTDPSASPSRVAACSLAETNRDRSRTSIGNAANHPKTYARLIGHASEANSKLKLLWIGCGTEDALFAPAKNFSEWLTANNIKHTFRETSGAHTWMVWRRYLNEVAPLLFR